MTKRAAPIAWHFPRTALAQAYIDTLGAGLISSVVLFAPRRKGKTEFLLEDLLPAAEARGYVTVYCSMWQNRSDPLAAILAVLALAAKPRSLGRRLQRRLLSPFKPLNTLFTVFLRRSSVVRNAATNSWNSGHRLSGFG